MGKPQQCALVFLMAMELSEQERRCVTVRHAGRHVGDVAPIAFGQAEVIEPRPDLGKFSTGLAARSGRHGSDECRPPTSIGEARARV